MSSPRFPEVALAFAVVVDEMVPVREVYEFIGSSKSKLIDRVTLFDVYRGKSLDEGKKSLAFNVYYRRDDRTLTEKEANEVHEHIADAIRKHGWDLR
jgi:phenylalanyl-tRNA synthetase beta chain